MKVTFQLTLTGLWCPDKKAAKELIRDFIHEGMIGIDSEDITIVNLEAEEEWEKEEWEKEDS